MTRMFAFADRNRKELLRDPLSLVFGVGLPVVLLVLISLMQRRIMVEHFQLAYFAPGMAMFSFSFVTLFSSMLIAKDIGTSLLARLFASPLTAADYLLGYTLPLLPIALAQGIVCYGVAMALGLAWSVNMLLSLVVLLPCAVLFVGLGLLIGSAFSDKQSGGITSILIQVVAFTSGMWFDLGLIGGAYETISYALPFAHALDASRAALMGQYAEIGPHLLWVIGYAVVVCGAAVWVFRRRMKGSA